MANFCTYMLYHKQECTKSLETVCRSKLQHNPMDILHYLHSGDMAFFTIVAKKRCITQRSWAIPTRGKQTQPCTSDLQKSPSTRMLAWRTSGTGQGMGHTPGQGESRPRKGWLWLQQCLTDVLVPFLVSICLPESTCTRKIASAG